MFSIGKRIRRKFRLFTFAAALIIVYILARSGNNTPDDAGSVGTPSSQVPQDAGSSQNSQNASDSDLTSKVGYDSAERSEALISPSDDPESIVGGSDGSDAPDDKPENTEPDTVIYDSLTGWHDIPAYASDYDSSFEDSFNVDSRESKLSVFCKAPFDKVIPAYDGTSPFYVLNGNVPFYGEYSPDSFGWEYYAGVDDLERCTYAISYIGPEMMPTEEREGIGYIKPTGWHTVKYDCVDGKYLYNRCHLIGYQLTGENANIYNLVTGTRYLNVVGMLPFENMVADYVESSGNHVMYRSTPVFIDDNLLCSGVILEAISCEDYGEGICFCVFCYNVQPGVKIDYKTGESSEIG